MSKDIMNDELAASADMMMDNVRFNIYKPKMGAQVSHTGSLVREPAFCG